MKVSVLIPTYNRRDYIVSAVESVLAQDFSDFEIIVVDDGSTDDTAERLRPYESRIRLIRTANHGPALARNVAMLAARGEYVAYLDSDDLYYPYKLGLQAALLDARPDVGMVYTEFSAFSDDGFWDETGPGWPGDVAVYIGDLYEHYLFATVVFTNSMMFRRSMLADVGLQQRRFGMFHDLEFALRLCRAAPAAFLDVPTYKLRYHSGQISTTNKPQGGRVAIRIQRDLLRVARHHLLRQADYRSRDRAKVDRHLAGLCRAAAVPLLAFDRGTPHQDRCYPVRARRYLALSRAHGASEPVLFALTYMPHLVRRVAFRLFGLDRSKPREGRR